MAIAFKIMNSCEPQQKILALTRVWASRYEIEFEQRFSLRRDGMQGISHSQASVVILEHV